MIAAAARTTGVLLAIAVTAPAAPAQAQERPATSPDPELDGVRAAYAYGRYADVLTRARERIDRGALPRETLVELHKYAGLAAFNLSQPADAERHFGALLRLDPDFALDPFAVPPPAIALFERVRKELAPQLELIRQQLRLDAERRRRETEERDRRRREEEERRRRLEEMSRRITVRTIERRSFLVNFVPFGAGQFQQGRTTAAVVLASLQGAFALTSVVAYLAYDGLLERDVDAVVDAVGGPITITRIGIRPERQREANAWRLVKYASAGAFYTLYGYGVVDALYHHEDERISESTLQLPTEPALPAIPPASEAPAPDSVRGFLFPTPGGIGAGFTLWF
jgi:hypothetical protein